MTMTRSHAPVAQNNPRRRLSTRNQEMNGLSGISNPSGHRYLLRSRQRGFSPDGESVFWTALDSVCRASEVAVIRRSIQILRDNMPFGHVGSAEMGTYFIGYSASPTVTEQMLTNMFIGNPVGNYDRILDFSTAVTGINFFVPTADFLDDRSAGPPLHRGPRRHKKSHGRCCLDGRFLL